MPALTRLSVTLPASRKPEEDGLLQAALALRVAHGWEEESLPDGALRCVIHCTAPGACSALAADLAGLFPSANLDTQSVEESNWVEAWKEFFTPVEAGSHFLVLAPWMEQERRETPRIPIIIEPKTAFGTGHHASTALCLAALSALHAENLLNPAARFLDLGTGSGILGIACAKLGLSGDALDNDPVAIENALENRALNAVSEKNLRLRTAALGGASKPYGLILANILAGPLIDMAPEIASLGSPLPQLILSGILDRQADSVEQAYLHQGFPKPRRMAREEWVALVFV